MFERFATRNVALIRYQSGRYSAERERFLTHLTDAGYSDGRLTTINRLLLHVVQHLPLEQDAHYGDVDLARIAKKWIRDIPDRGASAKTNRAKEMDFLFVATRWVKFLDRWVVREPLQPYRRELDVFLEHLRSERGFADATIENRQKTLRPFLSWLDTRSLALSDVGLNDIAAYQKECASRGWKRTTISFHVQSLRAFFRFGTIKGWCADIAFGIAAPRLYSNESIPQGPSWDDVRKILENESDNSGVQIRNRAMLLLYAVYGFRLSEVRLMQLEDLEWEKERILIRRSKVRKTHEYPLTREVGDAILRYLKEVRPKSTHREVFLSLRQPYRPLSAGGISAMVQKRMRRVNPALKRLGPHALRHACATHLLAEGFTFKQIGDHLGHVSVAATRIYAKVDVTHLREVAAMNLSELVAYSERAEKLQTPVIPHGHLTGLREVARLSLGAFA